VDEIAGKPLAKEDIQSDDLAAVCAEMDEAPLVEAAAVHGWWMASAAVEVLERWIYVPAVAAMQWTEYPAEV
jgi:hypothetical protein